jgi:transcriptional regulator GlxA family with amidase domain
MTSVFGEQMKINLVRCLVVISFFLMTTAAADGQTRSRKSDESAPVRASIEVRSSAAFAEVIFRRTELEGALQELLVSYKEEFPKVKNARYELNLIEAELNKMRKTKASEAGRLTLALGKLIVGRSRAATDYWILKNRYSDQHPAAKKAKRRFEIYDKAITEIL